MKTRERRGFCATSNQQPATSNFPKGFTLTEILIVIGIIVLMLALAVPAFRVLRGDRSINSAENQIAALLGRARSEAIHTQTPTGVFFYLDKKTGRHTAALVQATTPLATDAADVYLDLMPDVEQFPLTPGVGVQVVNDCRVVNGVRQGNGYIGLSTNGIDATHGSPYGGVILFDATGRLVSRTYGFRVDGPSNTASKRAFTAMGALLDWSGTLDPGADNQYGQGDFFPAPLPRPLMLHTQFGLVLYDNEAFLNNGGQAEDDVVSTGNAYLSSPNKAEEDWLDQNATPLLVNRYNGTLLRSE